MTIKESISKFLKSVIEDIIKEQSAKGIRSSGKSAGSLRSESTSNEGKIYGSGYFKQQEVGRRPGRFPPVQDIEDWIRAKGITPDGISIESLAFLIARKIAKNGTDIFQGKREGLNLKGIVNKRRDKLRSDLLKGTKEIILKQI